MSSIGARWGEEQHRGCGERDGPGSDDADDATNTNGLHESSLLDVPPMPVEPASENREVVKKDAMQPPRVKSRKKGSRKRTCPKVDMPKSR